MTLNPAPQPSTRRRRHRRYWDRQAAGYDTRMRRAERRSLAATRAWLCRHARGRTLEVAVGTGLNLPHYPADVRLTGVEWSPAMAEVAARRAAGLGRALDLHTGDDGDATALPFADGTFDTVVCTFALCCISDERAAIAEMVRVTRPGGLILLADHVASTFWPLRAAQAVADLVSVPWHGEHFSRRPVTVLREHDVVLERHERLTLGVIERVVARKSPAVERP